MNLFYMKKILIIIVFLFFMLNILSSSFFSYSTSDAYPGLYSSELHKPLILLFVEEQLMYNESLNSKIDRYAEDIKHTMNANVEKFLVNTSHNITQIKRILKQNYYSYNLIGSILIGNVTTPVYDQYPTVFPYQDLDNTYGRDIWLGIIRPPVEGEHAISLMKSYFDRNHDFHSKKIMFNRECILASTYEPDEILKERAQKSGRWNPDTLVGNQSNPKDWKSQYLKSLSTNVELLHFHGHGGPIHHDETIWSSDIKQHPPQAAIIYLQSCNTANFIKKDYIGGWYLFSGNSLAVISHSSPVWGFKGSGWGEGDNTVHILSIAGGSSIGDAVLYSHPIQESLVILGDPTLSLPKVSPKKDQLFTTDVGPIVIGRENTSIETSWYTDHLLSADFNNDGLTDVLIKNKMYINNEISSYPAFVQKSVNISGIRPCSIDFDYDGDNDIITAGESISLYENDGTATFSFHQYIEKNIQTDAVVANDFNNDGNVEIIATNHSGSVFYYEQSSTGFSRSLLKNISNQPFGMVSFDFDDDSDVDCVIGDRGGLLYFFENNGNATFNVTQKRFDGYYYHGLSKGDFDNDGDIDLLLNGVFSDHHILLNNGDGKFQDTGPLLAFSDIYLCLGVTSNDFDNDNDIDILLTHYDGIHFKENHNEFNNDKPIDLSVNGPSDGRKGKKYEYSITSIDPDDDSVFYSISWGDGHNDWIGPYDSNQEILISHIWDEKGSYEITVQVFDEFFYEGNSVKLPIQMKRNFRIIDFFYNLFKDYISI